jgi:hypothetical protein
MVLGIRLHLGAHHAQTADAHGATDHRQPTGVLYSTDTNTPNVNRQRLAAALLLHFACCLCVLCFVFCVLRSLHLHSSTTQPGRRFPCPARWSQVAQELHSNKFSRWLNERAKATHEVPVNRNQNKQPIRAECGDTSVSPLQAHSRHGRTVSSHSKPFFFCPR